MLSFLLLLAAFFGSVLAGLLGGGAGLIMTPTIFWFLSYQNPNADYVMQTSIVTMVTALMFSGLIGIKKHHDYRHIDWQTVRYSTLWVLLGTTIGCWLMFEISSRQLNIIFAVATLIIACRYVLQLRQISLRSAVNSHLIKDKTLTSYCQNRYQTIGGVALGAISTISGSVAFMLPYYEHLGLDIRKAIGTTSIVAWLYSLVILVVMVISGLNADNLPAGNIGFLNYRYLLLLTLPTIPGFMLGAKLTKMLPEKVIKISFIILLFCIAIAMLLK